MDRKFTLGLPTYRQEAEFERREIGISRQTMSNWILHFSRNAFEPVYGHLADILKKSGCTQCDETTLLVIRDGRKAGRKSYLWIHVTSELGNEHPITVICYEPDRSTRHLREFFEGYAGEIVCDAYSAYQTFETENGDTVIICGCWMHSRRRWAEALRVRNRTPWPFISAKPTVVGRHMHICCHGARVPGSMPNGRSWHKRYHICFAITIHRLFDAYNTSTTNPY